MLNTSLVAGLQVIENLWGDLLLRHDTMKQMEWSEWGSEASVADRVESTCKSWDPIFWFCAKDSPISLHGGIVHTCIGLLKQFTLAETTTHTGSSMTIMTIVALTDWKSDSTFIWQHHFQSSTLQNLYCQESQEIIFVISKNRGQMMLSPQLLALKSLWHPETSTFSYIGRPKVSTDKRVNGVFPSFTLHKSSVQHRKPCSFQRHTEAGQSMFHTATALSMPKLCDMQGRQQFSFNWEWKGRQTTRVVLRLRNLLYKLFQRRLKPLDISSSDLVQYLWTSCYNECWLHKISN